MDADDIPPEQYMDLLSGAAPAGSEVVDAEAPLYRSAMPGGSSMMVEDQPVYRSLSAAPVHPGLSSWGEPDMLSGYVDPSIYSGAHDFKGLGLASAAMPPRIFDEKEHRACHTRVHLEEGPFQAFNSLVSCCGSHGIQVLKENPQEFSVEAQSVINFEQVTLSSRVFSSPVGNQNQSVLVFNRISGSKAGYLNFFRTIRSALYPTNAARALPLIPHDHQSNEVEKPALEALLEMARLNSAEWAQQQTSQTLACLSENTENLKQIVELNGIPCVLEVAKKPCSSQVQLSTLSTLLHLAECPDTKPHLLEHVTAEQAQQMLTEHQSSMCPATVQVANSFIQALG